MPQNQIRDDGEHHRREINPHDKDRIAYEVIAIGASTGGTEAVSQVLRKLPVSVPGIVLVQHILPNFSALFVQRLNAHTGFSVKEATTGDIVCSGTVLVAPGNRHMRVVRVGNDLRVEIYEEPRVSGHCPSVDVLFNSVARVARSGAVGVLLTGMGSDGANGLLDIRRHGGRTIGQDERSSIVYGMPKVAFKLGAVEQQVGLQEVPDTILRVLKQGCPRGTTTNAINAGSMDINGVGGMNE